MQAQQPKSNPLVAALEALQTSGTFSQPLLSTDQLRKLANEDSEWTLKDLQFLLASIAQAGLTIGFGSGHLNPFLDPANVDKLLPVHEPVIDPENSSFTSSKGQRYVAGRIVSSAQGRVVHSGQNSCQNCQTAASRRWGKKRYCQCVTVSEANSKPILNGACSNCAHNNHPETCSFYSLDQANTDEEWGDGCAVLEGKGGRQALWYIFGFPAVMADLYFDSLGRTFSL